MRQLVGIEDNLPSKDGLLRVEWNLGKRCNYDCSYCDESTHDRKSPHVSAEVFERTIEKLMSAAAAAGRKLKIAYTGGEPFAHPHILDLLRIAKQKGVHKMSVTTNGSVPLDKYKAALEYLDYVIISYHFEFAYHDKVINTIIGINEECNRMTQAGRWRGCHTHIMFLPGHMDETREICQTMRDNGVRYVIRRIRPQYDPVNKDYLRPYRSGLDGVYQLDSYNISQPYYTDDEVRFMEDGV